MNIGEVIKTRRQKKNIMQAELAALLQVTPQAVSRWEMGISYPDIAMVPKISEVLQVSADELLGIKPSEMAQESGESVHAVLNQSQADSIFDYAPNHVTGESKRVLIVDDAAFMRMRLEDILTQHGHSVLQARDGMECLDTVQSETLSGGTAGRMARVR